MYAGEEYGRSECDSTMEDMITPIKSLHFLLMLFIFRYGTWKLLYRISYYRNMPQYQQEYQQR